MYRFGGDLPSIEPLSLRRGVRLEDAILDAAWAELVERGYPGLTLEGVARRADTSRPVLHRRWPSRTALATAALGRHLAQNPIVVPDLGSVRDEICLLLRRLSDRARPDMIRLVFDMQKDLADKHSSLAEMRAQLRTQIVEPDVMQTILGRAIDCGEIVDGTATIQSVGERFFEMMLACASGKKSKSELHGYGQNEFVPWQVSVIT